MNHLLSLVAQAEQVGDAVGSVILSGIYMAILVVILPGIWKVFTKAGQPGWGTLIPIYNLYLLCKIAGRPGWMVIFFFIPVLNMIFPTIICIDLARNFGKSCDFTAGMVFLPFVFIPILGFGSSSYQSAPDQPVEAA